MKEKLIHFVWNIFNFQQGNITAVSSVQSCCWKTLITPKFHLTKQGLQRLCTCTVFMMSLHYNNNIIAYECNCIINITWVKSNVIPYLTFNTIYLEIQRGVVLLKVNGEHIHIMGVLPICAQLCHYSRKKRERYGKCVRTWTSLSSALALLQNGVFICCKEKVKCLRLVHLWFYILNMIYFSIDIQRWHNGICTAVAITLLNMDCVQHADVCMCKLESVYCTWDSA